MYILPNIMNGLISEIKNSIEGEIKSDPISKIAYSVDASIYEVEPAMIVIPKNENDLRQTIKLAKAYEVPIIPRGAATGITGGCLGNGIVLDISKYLNKILEINFSENYAICEAGVVQDQLNQALSPMGYRLGPDTSTGNRATIGGMTANNSAGARSLRYGKMADHVLEIEMLLANGEKLEFHALNSNELQNKLGLSSSEGDLYRSMVAIRDKYRDEIDTRFPKLPRQASGYNLDAMIKPGPFNPCKWITGSEGTFGIFHKIKVAICKKAKALAVCVIHFDDMLNALHYVPELLQFDPMAFEMIDDQIIAMGRQAPSTRNKLHWLQGQPACVFAVEFDGETHDEAIGKGRKLQEYVEERQIGYSTLLLVDQKEMSHVWEVRKSGLGLLLSRRTYNRAIAFIEDLSIAPAKLPEFMSTFIGYLKRQGKQAGIYGHVGSGCMHVRPYINLRDPKDLALMEQMMLDVSDMILAHGGSLSGEHGDGLIRSWLNKKMFGEKLYNAFKELKAAFDPHHLMNPGKIVDSPPLRENLRASPETKMHPISTFLDFSREGGIELAADLCNGNGLCRKKEALMCPSFQATGDEYDTTRARAQALRAIINGRLPSADFTGSGLYDVLDLCLECKGCKTECPSQIDMAKMKAEVLFQYQEKHGYFFRNRLFAHIGIFNSIGSLAPSFVNWIGNLSFFKPLLKMAGISPHRSLPLLAKEKFSAWFKRYKQPENLHQKVVLFNDTFTEFNQIEVGQAAVKVLNALGYFITIPPWNCCGRPMISEGLLKQAKASAESLIETLFPYAKQNLPIICLEPSCLSTLKDDIHSLTIENRKLKIVSEACVSFDEFIAKSSLKFKSMRTSTNIKLHGHCHQKALMGSEHSLTVLRKIPGSQVTEIDSGCCGMAGSFGYEKEHYDLSIKIAELKLIPAITNSSIDDLIVANGFSCRAQILHTTGRKAKHSAQIIAEIIDFDPNSSME